MANYRLSFVLIAVLVALLQNNDFTEATEQTGDSNIESSCKDDARGYGNIALSKRTMQSSVYDDLYYKYGWGYPNFAVDGNLNAHVMSDCTHTNFESQPWWAVDLGGRYTVHAVTIYNRADCCTSRLSNFYIGLTDVSLSARTPSPNGPNYRVCSHHVGAQSKLIQTYQCPAHLMGRYLVVQLEGHDALHVGEVQVQASLGGLENLALHKQTYQSSVYQDAEPSLAVNGDVSPYWNDGSCSCTAVDSSDPWWAVDLGSIKEVYTVTLVNRMESAWRLANFNIGVTRHSPENRTPYGYPICAQHLWNQAPATTIDYMCGHPLVGRYVIVQILGKGTLTLCEVMVFGRDAKTV